MKPPPLYSGAAGLAPAFLRYTRVPTAAPAARPARRYRQEATARCHWLCYVFKGAGPRRFRPGAIDIRMYNNLYLYLYVYSDIYSGTHIDICIYRSI